MKIKIKKKNKKVKKIKRNVSQTGSDAIIREKYGEAPT